MPLGYVERVNRAVDHVVRHLADPLTLEAVSAAAHVSPFHFHRIFKACMGETLHQFVKRQRLERALRLLSHGPRRTWTEVALDCGFASSSDFSRSFRQRFGQSPRTFDLQAFRRSRLADFERLMADEGGVRDVPLIAADDNPDRFEVRLRDLPARTVAYIRVLHPYRPGRVQAASERLLAWAEARGLADGQWLGYMWDEPDIVALPDCRYDVALVTDEVEPRGEIGRFEFPAMRVAEVAVSGDLALEARAIDWLYRAWLPHSGCMPDDQPAFEAWAGRPYAHGAEHFEIAFQLPVRRW